MSIESLESQLIQLTQANANYQGRTIELSENKKNLEIRYQEFQSEHNMKLAELEEQLRDSQEKCIQVK